MRKYSYKFLVVSLPGSPKRKKIGDRLIDQEISWQWVDGVIIPSMEEIPAWEKENLEAYNIKWLKTDPNYVRRVVGCKRAMTNALSIAQYFKDKWIIVLQDDAVPVSHCEERLDELLAKVPQECGVVLLHWNSCFPLSGRSPLKKVISDIRSMAAFAIRPNYAGTLAKILSQWGREDDLIWLHLINQGNCVLAADPQLFSSDRSDSDIIGDIPELSRYLNK